MLDWHSCQICYPLEIKILLLLFDKTLSLVVIYPTTNAKHPISSVYLQLLCEIADKTYICMFLLLFFSVTQSRVYGA